MPHDRTTPSRSRLVDIPVLSREYASRKKAEEQAAYIARVWRPTDDVIDEQEAYSELQEESGEHGA